MGRQQLIGYDVVLHHSGVWKSYFFILRCKDRRGICNNLAVLPLCHSFSFRASYNFSLYGVMGCVWEQIESYIRDHIEAEFNHGICEECALELYPEFFKKIIKTTKLRQCLVGEYEQWTVETFLFRSLSFQFLNPAVKHRYYKYREQRNNHPPKGRDGHWYHNIWSTSVWC